MENLRYVNEKIVAEVTGLAVQTLRNHRVQRMGIPYIKINARLVRYNLSDVVSFMESHKIEPEVR